jgi:PASTA domain
MAKSNRLPTDYEPIRIIVDAEGQRIERLDESAAGSGAYDAHQSVVRSQPRRSYSLGTRRPPQARPIRKAPLRSVSRRVAGENWRRVLIPFLAIAAGIAAGSQWLVRAAATSSLALGAASLQAAGVLAASTRASMRWFRAALLEGGVALRVLLHAAGNVSLVVARRVWLGFDSVLHKLPIVRDQVGRALVASWNALAIGAQAAIRLARNWAARGASLAMAAWAALLGCDEALSADAGMIYRHRPPYARQQVAERPAILVPLLASLGVVLLASVLYRTTWPTLFAGFELIDTPTFTERPVDEAVDAARAQGLDVVVATIQPTEDIPKNVVIAQTPMPGADIRRGGVVNLTVSAGLRPPSVVGKPVDQARTLIVRQGWNVAPIVDTRVANEAPPDTVIDQDPAPEEVIAQKGAVRLTVAMRNLAFGKRVLTSAGASAPEAVDGDTQTVAVPGTAPNWVEVDFGGAVAIAEVHLLAAQDIPGPSVVEVWGWDTRNRFSALHMFRQETSDNATLSAQFGQPTSIVRLRVATVSAPGTLGWREIRVLDR